MAMILNGSNGVNKSQWVVQIYISMNKIVNMCECIILLFMDLEATFPDNIIFQISQTEIAFRQACFVIGI